MKHFKKAGAGFTLVELVVVVAVMALLGAMLLPTLAVSKTKVEKIICVNNLKQLGIAYRLWEGANNGRYPQAVTAANGGAFDYCTHGGNNSTIGTPANIAYNPGMV